ncbi:MAG: DUF2062 domain-containing protein [Prosthecobacter sp.]|nr:DUF2062 domain-containing protein [Prosthecobacter sp.]
MWLQTERYFLYHLIRLFRIRGQSEKVTRGFAVGLVVNFFPTFGFGVVISPTAARLCGGNIVAGFAGGALLTFVWPFLFFLNLRVGGHFIKPPVPINEFDDVTEKTMDALLWGQTFVVGAAINSIVVGGAVYLALRLLYRRIRPGALAYFRRHSAGHRLRFSSARLRKLKSAA